MLKKKRADRKIILGSMKQIFFPPQFCLKRRETIEGICQETFPLSFFLHKKSLDFKALATARDRHLIPVLQALIFSI